MIRKLIQLRLWAMLYSMSTTGRRRSEKAPSSKGRLILMAVVYLYLGGVFLFMFASAFLGLGALFLTNGMAWMYFSMFALLSFGMIFIGSVFTAKSILFEAKDNEFLLSLPIRPADVLWSRLLYLLAMNYLLELIVAIPAFVCWVLMGAVTVLPILSFILIAVLIPLFATAVSGGFAWVLTLITSRIQKKNVLTVVASLAFLGAYFYVVNNFDDYLLLFQENSDRISGAMARVLPIFWIGSSIGNGKALHLLYSVLFLGAPFALMVWILSKTYLQLLTTKRSGQRKKQKNTLLNRASTSFSALLRRECSRLFSSTTYLLNSAIAIPFQLIAVIAVILKANDIIAVINSLGIPAHGTVLCAVLTAMICLTNSMAMITAPSVSLEGKGISFMKSLPVSTQDIFRAKIGLHLILMIPTNLICALVCIFMFLPGAEGILLLLIVPNLFTVWAANVGLICNLCHPMLNWTHEAQPVKQSLSVMLSMLFGSVMLLGVGIGALLLSFINLWLTLIFACVVLGIADLLSYRYLMRGGVMRWNSLA